jgi:LmbE family N-acetylglucosaminyl deacetylase
VPDADGLAGRTILVVFAHPDDESLACGGTLARAADTGARVVLYCASRGEAGSAASGVPIPNGDLGRVRTLELRDAAAALGIAELILMDHPDGSLRWTDPATLRHEIALAVRHHRADAVITFDADGLYWHPDHIAMHEQATAAVESLGSEPPALYYVTMPAGVARAIVDLARAKRPGLSDVGFWGIDPEAFGQAANHPTLAIDVRGWITRKLAAIRCHRTQFGDDHALAWIDEHEARQWLGIEQFRRAPIGADRAPVLEILASRVADGG